MKTFSIILISFFISQFSTAADCKYSASADDIGLKWTAFKTPLKAGVSGTFKDLGITKGIKGESVGSLLAGIDFKINSASVNTKNGGRDATIIKNFFQVMQGGLFISGTTLQYSKKVLKVAIKMNNQNQIVPLKVDVQDDKIVANGVIDLFDFSMKRALGKLNQVCSELHEGKTWNDVLVELTVKYKKSCK